MLSLAVTAGLLQRDDLAQWPARRPTAEAAVRALGTALRALGSVLVLCTLVGFVVYASTEGVDGEALLFALPVLPNIGLLVLGTSWGVPVDYDLQGQVSYFGGGLQHGSFGLSELGEVHNGWAVTGALALGLVCALVCALWTARRSAGRREHVLAGAFFLGLYLLFTGFTGVSADLAGGIGDFGGAQGTVEVAPSLGYALLFGLLWLAGRCWSRRTCHGCGAGGRTRYREFRLSPRPRRPRRPRRPHRSRRSHRPSRHHRPRPGTFRPRPWPR